MKAAYPIIRSLPFSILIGSLAFLGGCQTYTSQSSDMKSAWQQGKAGVAAAEVTRKAEESRGKKDELLWRLEQGAVLTAAGNIQGGLDALDKAEEIVNRYELEADVKITDSTVSMFTNQANKPYRGRAYDKIMMNTYKALNHLLLNERDKARVELNRAFQRQENAVIENRKRIAEAQEAAEKAKAGELENEEGGQADSYDVGRAREDPKFSAAADAELARINERLRPYADYVNPFAVFLDGVFFSHMGFDNADIERARKSFERVNSMSPGNYIQEDFAMAERMANGKPADKVTYVLFSTGSAPVRDQLRIDIPLFLVTNEVSYAGAAFPKLEYRDNFIPEMQILASDGSVHTTELVADMDAVISKDFKNEWPSIVTKTLISSAVKAIAGKAVEDEMDGDWTSMLVAKVANIAYQSATNQADTRTWTTLPKQFAYARVPTPADGSLVLNIGPHEKSVTVDAGKTNVVMVRSVNSRALPIVNQFTLQ